MSYLAYYQRFNFVIRGGFEPPTHSLEGCCSIQLSYRTILISFAFAGCGYDSPIKTECKGNAFSNICKILTEFLNTNCVKPRVSSHMS